MTAVFPIKIDEIWRFGYLKFIQKLIVKLHRSYSYKYKKQVYFLLTPFYLKLQLPTDPHLEAVLKLHPDQE
jgi:hypothetical protein